MNNVTSKDGTKIAYSQAGSGFPLIMVDGAFCSRVFGLSVEGTPLLSPYFTVISYDRRGRDESGDTKPYSAQREIEDLDALIQMAGGSAHVFGHSSGAALALLATTASLNIKKLALYDPPYATEEYPSTHSDAAEVLTTMISEGKSSEAIQYFLEDLSGVPSFVVNGMRSSPFWKIAMAIAHTLPYDASIMGDCIIPVEQAGTIKIPVFVGGGDKTDIQSQKAVKALAEAIPGSALKIFDNQDHLISMKVLAPALVDFFG
ncbi:MAG: alpha/beta hydrolase [Ferruginibacter sp.]